MNLTHARQLAKAKMKEHGLTGWTFKFDFARRRSGCCDHRYKRIQLSKHYTKLNSEELVLNTILHEIAHALIEAHHGHDRVWKRIALSIGCSGERCASEETIRSVGKFVALCVCGKTYQRFKKIQKGAKYSCPCQRGKFGNKKHFLEFTLNEEWK